MFMQLIPKLFYYLKNVKISMMLLLEDKYVERESMIKLWNHPLFIMLQMSLRHKICYGIKTEDALYIILLYKLTKLTTENEGI